MSESERSDFGTPMSSDDAAELEELRREAAALREQLETALSAQGGLRSVRDIHQLEARIDSLAARNSRSAAAQCSNPFAAASFRTVPPGRSLRTLRCRA